MMKAIWNGEVIAESHETVVLEGTHYFPRASLVGEYFSENGKSSSCPWKGVANYYDVTVNGDKNSGAAWCYATAKEKAKQIEGRVAFWGGIQVVEG
jgi:uncharacterized protein (DUF427 family)